MCSENQRCKVIAISNQKGGLGFSRKRWITLKTMLENIIMGTSFKSEERI